MAPATCPNERNSVEWNGSMTYFATTNFKIISSSVPEFAFNLRIKSRAFWPSEPSSNGPIAFARARASVDLWTARLACF
mgnify:FL=1|jgi:hypothetical protein